MAPSTSSKCARDSTGSNNNDERRRREEKRRRDVDVAVKEADRKLEREAEERRREHRKARKDAEEQRVRAKTSKMLAAYYAGNPVAPTGVDEDCGEGGSKRTSGLEDQGTVSAKKCPTCASRHIVCHLRLKKSARSCWECNQRHIRCGRFDGDDNNAEVRGGPLGEMAAQIYQLTIDGLETKRVLARLEAKIDGYARDVRTLVKMIGGPDMAATDVDERKEEWDRELGEMVVIDDHMEVDTTAPPSTSDSDEDGTGNEEDKEEEVRVDRKGTGRVVESESEESDEESEEEQGDSGSEGENGEKSLGNSTGAPVDLPAPLPTGQSQVSSHTWISEHPPPQVPIPGP